MRTGPRTLKIMLLMSVQCRYGCYSNFSEVSFVYLYFLLKRIYLFLIYVYKFLSACVYDVMHMPSACKGQRRASDPLELEL